VPTWLIIVLAVLVLLAIGGYFANRRRRAQTTGHFETQLIEVNRDLAAAHAEDRGWERATLEEAARTAYAGARDGATPESLELVQVIDRPGTDDDHAVFRCGQERLTLGRRDGQWVLETLE